MLPLEKEIDAIYYGICVFIISLKKKSQSKDEVKNMLNRLVDDLFD